MALDKEFLLCSRLYAHLSSYQSKTYSAETNFIILHVSKALLLFLFGS